MLTSEISVLGIHSFLPALIHQLFIKGLTLCWEVETRMAGQMRFPALSELAILLRI